MVSALFLKFDLTLEGSGFLGHSPLYTLRTISSHKESIRFFNTICTKEKEDFSPLSFVFYDLKSSSWEIINLLALKAL